MDGIEEYSKAIRSMQLDNLVSEWHSIKNLMNSTDLKITENGAMFLDGCAEAIARELYQRAVR